jgi:hypothetical protein
MKTRISSMRDLWRIIEDQPIDTDLYIEDYVETVAIELAHLLKEMGFSWGDNLEDYDIPEEAFWECFEVAEKK